MYHGFNGVGNARKWRALKCDIVKALFPSTDSAAGDKNMGSDERRTYQRVLSSFKVDCIHEGDYIISFSRDLSVDGMFLCTDTPPKVGSCPKLIFTIGDLDEVEIKAEVAWVNTSEPAKYMGMGVHFIDPSPDLQDAILQIINRIAVLDEKETGVS